MRCRMFGGSGARYPVTDDEWAAAERQRQEVLRATAHAVPSGVTPSGAARVTESVGPGDDPTVPLPATADHPGGPVTIHRMDCRRREPALEVWAAEVEGIQARIFSVTHAMRERTLGAMIRTDAKGHPVIFVNQVRGFCPVLRVALIAHEAEHYRRGDLTEGSPFAWDAHAEAVCEDAAERRIFEACQLVDAKSPGAAMVNAATCVHCYREGTPCRQPAATFERIQQKLRL